MPQLSTPNRSYDSPLKETPLFKVLILGGYGNFGALISTALSHQHLPENHNIQVIIAGRNGSKAQKLAEELQCDYLTIDVQQDDLVTIFKAHHIALVISTIGPFQGQSYHIAQAAIAAKTHYIDLADSREFVTGITRLNTKALENDLLICAGASTVPGLSSAVVNHHLAYFSDLNSVDITLSASEKVPGVSTLSAVLSYAGQPFTTWQKNRWQTIYGLHNLTHHRFYHLPQKRWVSNCNIPDLALFPQHYPTLQNITFKAGVGISVVQWSASLIAFLRRFKCFPHPVKYANLFYKIAQKFEVFGDGLSAMQVKMRGKDQAKMPLEINWEIIGYDNEGPNIPCFASIILARKLANSHFSTRGAFSSANLITLDEYLAELKPLNIKTFTDFNPSDAHKYENLSGT